MSVFKSNGLKAFFEYTQGDGDTHTSIAQGLSQLAESHRIWKVNHR